MNRIFILIFSLLPLSLFAQEEFKLNLPAVSLNTGVLTLYGDNQPKSGVTALANVRPGYQLVVHERFLTSVEGSLNFLAGKVSDNVTESPVYSGGLNFTYHFDNGYLLKKESIVAPYLGLGLAFFNFHPYGDLTDAKGIYYNSWSDGSLRSLPQNSENAFQAKKLVRDYTYETDLVNLKRDKINYATTAFAFPLIGGLNFKLSPVLSFNLSAAYYFTTTDWLDDFSSEGKGSRKGGTARDGFLYSSVGLKYTFREKEWTANLDEEDMDKDGVNDFADRCPGTPAGLKVNDKGCPLDDDKDGVPNELDKDSKTPAGKAVDKDGVEIKKEFDTKKAGSRIKPTGEVIVPETTPASESQEAGLPTKFKWADGDGDGKISVKEINEAIDKFLDQKVDVPISNVYELINYFFDN